MTYLLVFIICLSHLLVICVATHARIGKYPDLGNDNCGIGRETPIMDDSCFKWHKVDDSMSKIMNGREAMLGEVPYLVYILVKHANQTHDDYDESHCTGAILNKNMAVTAAHCFDIVCDECFITSTYLIFGQRSRNVIDDILAELEAHNSTVSENVRSARDYFLHPGYVSSNYSTEDYEKQSTDIAIVYWDIAIEWREYEVQPICLPESGIINNGVEYGMLSGWGANDLKENYFTFLPMGWVQILPAFNNQSDQNGDMVLAKIVPYPGGTVPCVGDSGGPLIQYVHGRAVLIGTVYGDLTFFNISHPCTFDNSSVSAFVRVSRKIDWIIATFKKAKDMNSTLEGSEMDYPSSTDSNFVP